MIKRINNRTTKENKKQNIIDYYFGDELI